LHVYNFELSSCVFVPETGTPKISSDARDPFSHGTVAGQSALCRSYKKGSVADGWSYRPSAGLQI